MLGDHRVIRRGMLFVAALCGLYWVNPVLAQIANGNQWPKPRLTILTPCGGKQGTSIEVGWTGSDLGVPDALIFSHPGIKATQVIPPPPKVDPKADPKKPVPPTPITRFNVTIGKEVPPGFYDCRAVNKLGVSNPRVFVVDALDVVAEKDPNDDVEQAQKVTLGTTVAGSIGGNTDVDYYSFNGKKGQRILIVCLGPSIDSRLHPEMKLFDSAQKQLLRDWNVW